MRAIRLRAIPLDDFDAAVSEGIHGDGVFVFGWGAQDCHDGTALFMRDDNDGVIVRADTVGRSTGFKDSSGTEIYEGDIVCCNDEPKVIAAVKCGNYGEDRTCYHTGFYIDWIEKIYFLRNDIRYWIRDGKIKVIGNIYNNSDLIGGNNAERG